MSIRCIVVKTRVTSAQSLRLACQSVPIPSNVDDDDLCSGLGYNHKNNNFAFGITQTQMTTIYAHSERISSPSITAVGLHISRIARSATARFSHAEYRAEYLHSVEVATIVVLFLDSHNAIVHFHIAAIRCITVKYGRTKVKLRPVNSAICTHIPVPIKESQHRIPHRAKDIP